MTTARQGAILIAALLAPLSGLAGGGAAVACDIKIHEAAYKQWPREFYLLYLVHDGQAKLSPAQEQMAKNLREKHFKDTNADVIKLDLAGSMLREDREFLHAQGCGGWPQMIIMAKDGGVIARTSGKLGDRELRYLAERSGELSKDVRAVVLYRKSDPESLKQAEAVTAESLEKAELKGLKPELVDAEDPANKALAERFNPPKLPAMFLVSPRGNMLASFPGDIREEALAKSFDSPGRQQLTKALDRNAITFVLVASRDKKANAEAEKKLKGAIRQADKLMKIRVGRVDVAGDDAAETVFLRNLGVKELPAIVPVFGKGKHLEPLADKELTEEALLDRAGFMLQNCTCVLDPSALGEDLMLKWKGIDEKVKVE